MRRVLVLIGLLSSPLVRAQSAPPDPPPKPPSIWRLGNLVGTPAWLTLEIDQNSRVEYLSNDFRAMSDADTRGLFFRTVLTSEVKRGWFRAKVELLDARGYATDVTPLNTSHIDPVEILQAYVGLERTGVIAADDQLAAKVGRMTIDMSSSRTVARSQFRNTVTPFTGADVIWTSPGKHVVRTFVAAPVTSLPSNGEALRHNQVDLDKENTDALLWGCFYGTPKLYAGTRLELYAVGLHERDGEIASRNRQLVTMGVRWFRKPAIGQLDFRIELFPQLGTSRATTAMDDTTDLTHRAFSSDAAIGITADMPWRPRFALEHDYASGDRDRDDNRNGTFDPIFGERRFDFGPTGIYGPFIRSNIHTPGIRISADPAKTLRVVVGYRLFWLASSTDAWAPAGDRDPTGASGSFLGEQVEVMTRWTPIPNLQLEIGGAYLRAGNFAKAFDTGNATYVYTQTTLRL